MANLKARVAEGKCVECWQKITETTVRPTKWFQGELYHIECWDKKYRAEKKANTKKAQGKRSF